MQTSNQNLRGSKLNDYQASIINYQHQKKFNYLQPDNSKETPYNIQESMRARILQTISQEALSEDKGSISNRSQNHTQNIKIYKNLSQRVINQNKLPDYKVSHNGHQRNEFLKKSGNSYNIVICDKCVFYQNKIVQLQSSYQLLLQAKNEQLEECKIIIQGMQKKINMIQKRSQQQIQKNKRFRNQIQRKTNQDLFMRDRQNEMIQYLKNREIVLLQQMKQLQNEIYIKEIKKVGQKDDKRLKQKQKRLNFNTKHFNSTKRGIQRELINNKNKNRQKIAQSNCSQQNSVSEYSAKTFDQQYDIQQEQKQFGSGYLNQKLSDKYSKQKSKYYQNKQLKQNKQQKWNQQNVYTKQKQVYKQIYESCPQHRYNSQLIDRVPFGQIIKKNNEIQCLKDDLMISELKNKIQQTKTLQNFLLIK